MCGTIDYGAAASSMARIGLVFAVIGIVFLWKMKYFLAEKFKNNMPDFASSLMQKLYAKA